jgi:hypothetical protein
MRSRDPALNLPYSPFPLNYFPRILGIRRKNEEYTERKFYLQQGLGILKGKYFEKIKLDD